MLSKKRSMSFAKRTLLSVSLSLVSGLSFAKMYELPEDGSRLIGRLENHVVQEGETMANIAKHYDVGMLALMAANKGVDPFLPQEGRVLTIPSQLILPEVPHQGIVINLAELRLYYFPEGEDVVHVFPVGIGRIGRDTPVMTTSISQKTSEPNMDATCVYSCRIQSERGGFTCGCASRPRQPAWVVCTSSSLRKW